MKYRSNLKPGQGKMALKKRGLSAIVTIVLMLSLGTICWAGDGQTKSVVQPPNKIQDYRSSPEGKLLAAKQYVDKFLTEDADPNHVFALRAPIFPVWRDQPIRDCNFDGAVDWIEAREPYFESDRQDVVVVPVWAELLMVIVGGESGWGRDVAEDGKSWCKWEYERYDPDTRRFERLPHFRTSTYADEFSNWGVSHQNYQSPHQYEVGAIPRSSVAIDQGKRVVRYLIRVNVTREKPYRLMPQVPRHWGARDVISRLEQSNLRLRKHLLSGVSIRSPLARGEELERDLESMRHQIDDNIWMIDQLNIMLSQPITRPPYPGGKPSTNTLDTH